VTKIVYSLDTPTYSQLYPGTASARTSPCSSLWSSQSCSASSPVKLTSDWWCWGWAGWHFTGEANKTEYPMGDITWWIRDRNVCLIIDLPQPRSNRKSQNKILLQGHWM
jgi:hypothetical protein